MLVALVPNAYSLFCKFLTTILAHVLFTRLVVLLTPATTALKTGIAVYM